MELRSHDACLELRKAVSVVVHEEGVEGLAEVGGAIASGVKRVLALEECHLTPVDDADDAEFDGNDEGGQPGG